MFDIWLTMGSVALRIPSLLFKIPIHHTHFLSAIFTNIHTIFFIAWRFVVAKQMLSSWSKIHFLIGRLVFPAMTNFRLAVTLDCCCWTRARSSNRSTYVNWISTKTFRWTSRCLFPSIKVSTIDDFTFAVYGSKGLIDIYIFCIDGKVARQSSKHNMINVFDEYGFSNGVLHYNMCTKNSVILTHWPWTWASWCWPLYRTVIDPDCILKLRNDPLNGWNFKSRYY